LWLRALRDLRKTRSNKDTIKGNPVFEDVKVFERGN
jgi:hypothetical protein